MALAVGAAASLVGIKADGHSHSHCEDVVEVEIYGPEKSLGKIYMEDMTSVSDYDGSKDSLHFDASPG